jgi:hypothetical protein
MVTPDVLVLGGSGAGKTHYVGQLLGRLRHDRQGELRLRPGSLEDLTKLEEVLACLEEGRAAGHTPAETWTGVKCELETKAGARVVLEWPEYAGERLFSILERRTVPSHWRESVASASGWVLLLRPSILQLYEDLLQRPSGASPEAHTSPETLAGGRGWDDRARYVELLQVLLFAARLSTFHQLREPRLAVVLSCWDELETDRTPEEVLAARLPLLDAYIRATWHPDTRSVWGLSSLGRALSQTQPDADFALRGPENFGYVVPPGTAKRDKDLTAPVAWLLAGREAQ